MKRDRLKLLADFVLKLLLVTACQVVGFAIPAIGLLSVGLAAGRKAMAGYTVICLMGSGLLLLSSLTGEMVALAYVPGLEPVFDGAKSLTVWQLVNFPIAWVAFFIIQAVDRRLPKTNPP